MKKTLIMKIMSGAVLAAVCVAGAVSVAATGAGIFAASENSAYAAEADAEGLAVSGDALAEGLAVSGDALAAAETKEAEDAEDGAGTAEGLPPKRKRLYLL